MGMDATVADGGPDLVFKNDTKYGILIRASASASTMTVTLYSTDRGLRVEKIAGLPHAQTEPKARYILNPALEGAEKSQRTAGQGGFAITVERIVKRKGKVVSRDTFSSNYIAESQLFVVGPQFVPDRRRAGRARAARVHFLAGGPGRGARAQRRLHQPVAVADGAAQRGDQEAGRGARDRLGAPVGRRQRRLQQS